MKIVLFFIVLLFVLYLVSKDWKKVGKIASGWGITGAIDWVFNYPIWVWFQTYFGLVTGSIYVSLSVITLNVVYILVYQASGQDWLGVNVLEQVKRDGKDWSNRMCSHKNIFYKIVMYIPAKIAKLLVWSLNKTEWTTFLVFSIFSDSFKTTIFMHHGRVGKLTLRDLWIFLSSSVISCVGWSLCIAPVTTLLKTLFG